MAWHTTTCIVNNVYRISEPFGFIDPDADMPTTVNMYLVIGQERVAVIDSGMGIGDIRTEIRHITSLPCLVLNTHAHWDHIGANARFVDRAIHAREAELLTHEPDVSFVRDALQAPSILPRVPSSCDPRAYRIIPGPATQLVHDNDLIDLGGRRLRVLHTPGHSPGHVAYFDDTSHLLFTGDVAYRGPLCACFEGGDPVAFAHSVRRLAALQHVAMVCPGHNELITQHTWLNELAKFIDAAIGGHIPGQGHSDPTMGREFRCGDMSIWLSS